MKVVLLLFVQCSSMQSIRIQIYNETELNKSEIKLLQENEGRSRHSPISHFTLSLTHTAMVTD